MDKKTIEEQTSLALFEGAIKEDHCHYMIPDLNRIVWVEKMLYASDWNWIMRIVDKIESLKDVSIYINKSMLGKQTVEISYEKHPFNREGNKTIFIEETIKIQAVYKACIEFIQWYNANIKQDGSN